MLETIKRIKRLIQTSLLKRRIRREARAAFKYDLRQFEEHAGALHLENRAASISQIVMGYHVLEKGLTMPRRRLGFGKQAVLHLVNLVNDFENRFGKDSQVEHAIGVLRAYRELHHEWHEPMLRLDSFLAKHGDIPSAKQPHVSSAEFFAARNAPFPEFAASRHVVRHYSGAVPRDLIEDAVKIAMTAPSACNRQHARVHVIDDAELRDKLFALQGGTRGFGMDADKVIVITADLSAIRWGWERHDCYVNGGIFVMNLCYALHYKGIAHCILHWSVSPENDCATHELVGIPDNEVIVSLIACGMPPEEFDVASSPRRPLEDILTWHGGVR